MNPAVGESVLKVWGPLAVTVAILAVFTWGFYLNPNDPGMLEIIKNLLVLAVGFWIGSSGGSKSKGGEANAGSGPLSGAVTVTPPVAVVARRLTKAEAKRRTDQADLLNP